MNYETAAKKYVELRNEIDRINAEAKRKVVELKKLQIDIENWFSIKAEEEGLKTVPTTCGTAYWSTHHTASVAEATAFKDYVFSHPEARDLIEARASKLAVKSFIDAHGTPPPGVNFSSIRVFNLRKPPASEEK